MANAYDRGQQGQQQDDRQNADDRDTASGSNQGSRSSGNFADDPARAAREGRKGGSM